MEGQIEERMDKQTDGQNYIPLPLAGYKKLDDRFG